MPAHFRLPAVTGRSALVFLLMCLLHVFAFANAANQPLATSLRASARERLPNPNIINTAVKLAPESAQTSARPTPTPTPVPPRSGLVQQSGMANMASPNTTVQMDQGSQYGQPGFVGEPADINVTNADIRDVLNYFTQQYGVNFVIDSSVGAVPVTINVSNVPWNLVLDSILQANRLGVQKNGNLLRVATTEVLASEAATQQKIRDAQLDNSQLVTEFIRLNYARASGTLAQAAGSTGGFAGGATNLSFSGGAGGDATGGGGEQGLLPIITRRLSRRGAIEIDGRTNTLIITDVRENIDAIRQLVALLDTPEPQVEIETRIVVATRNFSRNLGVQLAATVLNSRTGATGSISTGQGVSVTNGSQNLSFPSPNGLLGGVANTVIGLTTGAIGTAQISAAISLAETKREAKVVATPRVTALNNRPAQIESGEQIPVQTTGALGVVTTTFVSVPLRLSVTPQITDAGTVILHVTAENNTVGNRSVGGVPGIITQRMQSEVLVPDGGTTVMGGVLNDNEDNTQNRTPGISGVPVLGNLFKRKTVARDTTELLFFITPRIYRPDFAGRPTSGTASTTPRVTTIPQPVPLGNPSSNTPTPTQLQQQQQQQQQPTTQNQAQQLLNGALPPAATTQPARPGTLGGSRP